MTKIIFIPNNISQEFPDATISNPQRLRILAQVKLYIPEESILIIDKVPTIPSQESIPMNIYLFNILESCSSRVLNSGTIINIDGFFDGETINPVDIYEVNGANFTIENIQLIEEMNRSIGHFDGQEVE